MYDEYIGLICIAVTEDDVLIVIFGVDIDGDVLNVEEFECDADVLVGAVSSGDDWVKVEVVVVDEVHESKDIFGFNFVEVVFVEGCCFGGLISRGGFEDYISEDIVE